MKKYILLFLLFFTFSPSFLLAEDISVNEEDAYFNQYSRIDVNDKGLVTYNKDAEKTSLSDFIDKKSQADINNRDDSETWLDKLRSETINEIKNPQEVKKKEEVKKNEKDSPVASLKSMLEDSKSRTKDGKSNAAVFDISGAMLRMSPMQIDETLSRRGYRKTTEKFDIPNFIKWRKEDECRAAGVVGFERLANCVVKLSKKEKYEYLELVKYSKFDTREDITIKFTSNFTNNKSYKIEYTSMAGMVKGNTQKANYIRNIKIYDFWKRISHKYGTPDNKEDAIWGLGGNKPYMQATSGKLVLEDPMLKELDYTRMSREDQKFINTSLYNF